MNIILLILGTLIVVGTMGYAFFQEYDGERSPIKRTLAGVTIGVLIMILSTSFVIIPTGYTGIKKTFGQISKNTLPNGFSFKIPIVQTVEKVNNKQQDISFEDTKISSETSERNEVFFSGITITYKINPEKSAWIAANITDYENNLLSEGLISSAIKSAAKTLSPVEVTNRSKLEPIAEENIQKSIDEKYGKNVILINKVVINNATFDSEYNEKIAKKQQAQMDYEKQQIENKKAIEKAEADAKVKKTTAEADADAKRISASAEADANKKIADSITEKLINNKLAEARLKHGWVTVNGSNTVVTDNK